MHYHVRMDRPEFRGIGKALGVEEKDFRSLQAFLNWLQQKFGKWAVCWQIHGIGNVESDARKLLPLLQEAIEEDWQWVYMGLNESCPDYRKCDAYCFTVAKREGEPANGFSFTEEEESSVMISADEESRFVDLYKEPLDASLVSSFVPVYDNAQNLFCGMAIMLKDGCRFLVVAGINQDEERFNLGLRGVSKDMIEKIIPSTPDGMHLHGFIVRLSSGSSLYLTIGKMLPKPKNPTCGGKDSPAR